MNAYRVASPSNYSPSKPVRDEAYKKFIRGLCCAVCAFPWRIEAAHTGPHGVGQKSSDLSCIPLCVNHHRKAADSLHALGPARFAARHDLDIGALIGKLNAFYSERLMKPVPPRAAAAPFFTEAQPCESCGAPVERREWNPEHEIWIGVDCACNGPDDPACAILAARLAGARTIADVQAVIREHWELCPKCGGVTRKEATVEGGSERQSEVA